MSCASAPRAVRVDGNRAYNPGWRHALDLRNLIIVSRRCSLALSGKESGVPTSGRSARAPIRHSPG